MNTNHAGRMTQPNLINQINENPGAERNIVPDHELPQGSPSSMSLSSDIPRLRSVSQSFADSPSHSFDLAMTNGISSSPDDGCLTNGHDAPSASSSRGLDLSHENGCSSISSRQEHTRTDNASIPSSPRRIGPNQTPHRSPRHSNGSVNGNGVRSLPEKKTPSPSKNQKRANIAAAHRRILQDRPVPTAKTVAFSRPINVDAMTYIPTKEFDNEHGDLNYKEKDIFVDQDNDRRYRVLSSIGSGTFGQVVKVELLSDSKEEEDDDENAKPSGPCFAIKVIKNKEAYHVQALKETTILQKLNERWDPHGYYNIIRLYSAFYDKGHLMLVFPVLGWNLYELLRSHQHRGFKTSVVQVFVQQVVSALVCLAQAGIVHTDLKPENILLESSERWKIKVIDFGSASYENHHASTYIQSRFYRAPEVILGVGYNRAIDMWSLGCIAAELYLGLPLFPGKNEYNQLKRITKVLKQIPDKILSRGARTGLFYEQVRNASEDGSEPPTFRMKDVETWAQENRTAPVSVTEYFPGESLEEIIMARNLSQTTDLVQMRIEHQGRILLVDFVRNCLEYDFLTRMTPAAARKHPFLDTVPPEYKPPPSDGFGQTPQRPPGRRSIPRQTSAHHQSPQSISQTARDMQSVIAARSNKRRNRPWKHKSYDVGQHRRAEEEIARRQMQQMRAPLGGGRNGNGNVPPSPRSQLPRQRSVSSIQQISVVPPGPPRTFGQAQAHTSPSFNPAGSAGPGINGLRFPTRPIPHQIPQAQHRDANGVRNRRFSRQQLQKLYEKGYRASSNERRAQTATEEKNNSPFGILGTGRPLQRSFSHNASTRARSNTVPGNAQLFNQQGANSQLGHPRPSSHNRGGLQRSISDSHTFSPLAHADQTRLMHALQGNSNGPPRIVHVPSTLQSDQSGQSAHISQTQRGQPGPAGQVPQGPQGQRPRIVRHDPHQFFAQRSYQRGPPRTIRPSLTNVQVPAPAPAPAPSLTAPFQQLFQETQTQRGDYYAPYMHQYISARGQQQNLQLGQATRPLRTWQTPQTRYF